MTIDMDYYRKINGLIGTTSKVDYLQKQAIKSVNNAHNHVLSTFDVLISSDIAEDIIVDNTTNIKCIFDYSKTSKDTKTELSSYTKEMWIEVGITSVGSIIKHTDKVSLIENTYIVVSKQEDSKGYDLCYIQRSNNTLLFYDSSSTLHSIPCIISKGSISLDEQKIISTLDSEIAVQISNTSITRQIKINNVYRIGLRNYTVTDINDITIPGLLLLKMVYSEVEQVIPTHNYSIDILNGISASITQNETLQLNVSITDNSIEISPTPIISYVSSDESVCTVDSSGLVTAINSEGNCTIIVTYQNVSDSIELLVVTEIQHNYTVNIVPSGILKVGQTITAVAQFMDNGVVTGDIATQWKLFADDGVSTTTLATITPLGNNCSIKAGTSIGYVRLYVENENCSNVVRVQVASLW